MMTETLRTFARDRRRSIAVLVAVPFAIAALTSGGWLVARDAIAERVRDQYNAPDLVAAENTSRALGVANIAERWIYYFDRGTVMAARASDDAGWRGSEQWLRTALSLASGQAECPVRFNLSLVLEWRAEATADARTSAALYGEAAQIAAEAPRACDSLPGVTGGGEGDSRTDGEGDPDSGGDSLGDQLDDAAQRNSDNAEARARDLAAEPGGEEQTPETGLPDQDRLDELEERLQDAQDEQVGEGWDSGGTGGGPAPGEEVPRPW